jgi:hypothetical protein
MSMRSSAFSADARREQIAQAIVAAIAWASFISTRQLKGPVVSIALTPPAARAERTVAPSDVGINSQTDTTRDAAAREEVWQLLQSTIHYCRCAQLHLEVDDDVLALYDMRQAREHFIRAIREFEPLRRTISERIGAAEQAA